MQKDEHEKQFSRKKTEAAPVMRVESVTFKGAEKLTFKNQMFANFEEAAKLGMQAFDDAYAL